MWIAFNERQDEDEEEEEGDEEIKKGGRLDVLIVLLGDASKDKETDDNDDDKEDEGADEGADDDASDFTAAEAAVVVAAAAHGGGLVGADAVLVVDEDVDGDARRVHVDGLGVKVGDGAHHVVSVGANVGACDGREGAKEAGAGETVVVDERLARGAGEEIVTVDLVGEGIAAGRRVGGREADLEVVSFLFEREGRDEGGAS